MSKMLVLGIALVLLLASLPLISIGTMQENATLWWAGLGLLIVGGAVPPVTRFVIRDDDDDGDEEEDDSGRDRDEDRDEQGEGERDQRPRGREQPAGSPPELRARAHEERAAAHRERARSHEELAAADEQRAIAEEQRRREAEEARRRSRDADIDVSREKEDDEK
jgi:hypothetical protein